MSASLCRFIRSTGLKYKAENNSTFLLLLHFYMRLLYFRLSVCTGSLGVFYAEGNDGLIRFKNLKISSVADVIEKIGREEIQGTQIMKWVYQKRVDSFN